MNKKQIDKIIKETKKRNKIIKLSIVIIAVLFVSSIFSLYASFNQDKNYYLHYDEKSDLDYKVYLKDNDYFGPYLGKGNQYIASLINYIEANFTYELSIKEDIDYSYYYYIESTLDILDNNDKKLYQKVDTVLPKQTVTSTINNSFTINKTVNLDYNYYNTIASAFIKRYNLTGTNSKLTLKLHIGIKGNCEGYEPNIKDDAVISMSMPLTTNTVNVDMNYVLNNGTDKLIECVDTSYMDVRLFTLGIILIIVAVVLTVRTTIYAKKTKNCYTIYNKGLKDIFNNYGQYISKIQSELSYNKFQIVLVEEFEDLFEIRNSSGSPILFCQEPSKTKSAFIVPTNSGLVYIYYYSMNRIMKEEGKNED